MFKLYCREIPPSLIPPGRIKLGHIRRLNLIAIMMVNDNALLAILFGGAGADDTKDGRDNCESGHQGDE